LLLMLALVDRSSLFDLLSKLLSMKINEH